MMIPVSSEDPARNPDQTLSNLKSSYLPHDLLRLRKLTERRDDLFFSVGGRLCY